MSADLRVRWHLELVDKASSTLLRNDRAIRKSLQETDRAQDRLAKSATAAGAKRVRGSQQTATALLREGRAATTTQRDVQTLNRAQAQALSAGSRLASSAQRVAGAYRAQAQAARQLSAAERARAAASGAAARVAGGAAATGAGLTRGVQGTLAAAAGGGIVAKGVATFAGFEQQMDRVLAVSGATRQEFSKLNAQAKQLGADTSFSAREAADGMYQLSTAGFSAQEVMRTIPGTLDLAAASGTDLASAAELQATALRGFGLAAGDAGRVADALTVTVNRSAVEMFDLSDSLKYIAPVARATGQSMESMLAALGLMGNVGVKGTQAGTTLRTALVRLTAPTEKSANALQQLGIRGNELRGPKGLLPLPQIMRKIVDGAQGLDKGTRNAAIAAIFGREALSGMIAMIDQGPAALERNIKALQSSEGQAKRTSLIMRDNVAGAWDQFTGSLETAAIVLTTRFGPALKNALKGGASGINAAAGALGDLLGGIAGDGPAPSRALIQRQRGPQGLAGSSTRLGGRAQVSATRRGPQGLAGRSTRTEGGQDPSAMRQVGTAIGGALRTVGKGAAEAGAQLLDAFKPALPFFQNVLLPVLEGLGKSLLGTVVGAFKIIVPVIKAVATVLGFIGRAAKPIAPVLRGVGAVLGFLLGGLLAVPARGAKVIAFLGKFGILGKVVGLGVRLMLLPIRLVVGAFGALGPIVGKAAGAVGRGAERLFRTVIVNLAALPNRLANLAAGAISRLVSGIRGGVGKVRSAGQAIANGLISFVVRLPGRIGGLATRLASSFIGLGRKIASAIVEGIKAAPGIVLDAVKSLIPGPLRGAASKLWDTVTGGRRGGIMRRAGGWIRRQAGGLIPAAVSPGELVTYGDAAWTVPGARTAADSVHALLPAGAAVWTDSGQAMLAQGMDPRDVLASQLPHFAKGGIVQAATSARGAGLSGSRLVTAVAVAGPESKYDPNAHALTAKEDSRGFWQINVRAHPNWLGRNLYNPDVNARAMAEISGHGRNWRPWTGYTSGAYRRYVERARKAVTGTRGAGSSTDDAGGDDSVRIPLNLSRSKTRAGLLEDAFAQGRSAGQAGLTRAEIRQAGRGVIGARANPLVAAIRGAQSSTVREVSTGVGGGKTGDRVRNMIDFAKRAGQRFPRYVYGGGHGSFSGPYDCSGYVSAILHAGGFIKAPMDTNGLKGWAQKGSGKQVTVGVRGSSGRNAHTMIRLGNTYWESANRRGPTGERPSWSGSFPIKRHPGGYARGGLVGVDHRALPRPLSRRIRRKPSILDPSSPEFVGYGLRAGGLVGFRPGGTIGSNRTRHPSSPLNVATIGAGASLTVLDEAIGAAVETRLLGFRAALLRVVRRGGDKRTIQRLQGAIDLIDGELGRRIGAIEAAVERRTARTERSGGMFDRILRAGGVDADSTVGLRARMAQTQAVDLPAARANVTALQTALKRARRSGAGREAIAEIETKLNAAQDEVSELVVSQIESARAVIRRAAQDQVDAATFGLELTQNAAGAGLDAAQRLDRTADTPGGMLQKAEAIRGQVIPGMQNLAAAQQGQLNAAIATGDVEGARSAMLALQTTSIDLANALADGMELVRNAAQRAAQDLYDTAAHSTSLASSGLQRLELEQKLAGTYETGGAARANAINTTLIPALQAELQAINAQADAARAHGLVPELRAAIEAANAKGNEILQAQLDALEAVEANTTPRKFGGTLGFSHGDETLTDSLIAVGNGA